LEFSLIGKWLQVLKEIRPTPSSGWFTWFMAGWCTSAPQNAVVFAHACKLGVEGIVSKRLGSKFKNPAAPADRREAEENWDQRR
jgi:hypothetical protein